VAAVFLTTEDLTPFADIEPAKAQAMIDDVTARAARVAPCIFQPDFVHLDAVRAILRGVVLRWHEAGSGALQTASVDDASFSFDTRQQRRTLFWPSEVEELQGLCKTDGPAGAFSVDMVGAPIEQHADICALRFGATYCSCGAVLTGAGPLWEQAL
jgi:hypothetical protein